MPVHADSHVHRARFAPQNRPDRAVFSLSSAGGEGWGEEAVFPGGSWGGGVLYLTNQANPPIGHCPGPVSQQLDEELDAPLQPRQPSWEEKGTLLGLDSYDRLEL